MGKNTEPENKLCHWILAWYWTSHPTPVQFLSHVLLSNAAMSLLKLFLLLGMPIFLLPKIHLALYCLVFMFIIFHLLCSLVLIKLDSLWYTLSPYFKGFANFNVWAICETLTLKYYCSSLCLTFSVFMSSIFLVFQDIVGDTSEILWFLQFSSENKCYCFLLAN